METNQDLVIISEVLSGDRMKFSELVKKYQKDILRLSLRMTRNLELAEDIVQEVFIKAFRKLHLFKGLSPFKSWLYQIAVNTTKNKLRTKPITVLELDKVQLGTNGNHDRGLQEIDLKELLKAEIDKLPAKQKMALELRIFEDLSFKEIADLMQCPYDTAKANYRHALMKLRQKLVQTSGIGEWLMTDNEPSVEFMGYVPEAKQ